jgi:uncharacterized protein YegL
MPRLNDPNMEENQLPNTSFGYSAVRIDDLEATEYTLVTLVIDTSGSVYHFQKELESCIKEIVNSCKFSPRADNLMIRLVGFSNDLYEIHGYKLLSQCNIDDYKNILNCGGATALYDAAETGIRATSDYGKTLIDNDFSANGVVYVLTDGEDNSSVYGPKEVHNSIKEALNEESLDSINTILVSLNTDLSGLKDVCGFDSHVTVKDANAKALAKLAQFVSKSISAQSQSLGSGNAALIQSATF